MQYTVGKESDLKGQCDQVLPNPLLLLCWNYKLTRETCTKVWFPRKMQGMEDKRTH